MRPRRLTIDAPPMECIIGGKETQEYTLSLTAGQFVAVTALQNGVDVVVEVYAPDGTSLMRVDSPNGAYGPEGALVTAGASGTYRIVIRPWNESGPGKYALSVKSAGRFTAERAKIKSPRLRQLWVEIMYDASGGSDAVAQFIQEREEAQAPLMEAIPGDDGNILVTLVYLGDASTRNVRVEPSPTVEPYLPMERFANTDLWTASMTVPTDTRLFYAFLVFKAVELNCGATNSPLLFSEERVPDRWNPARSLTWEKYSEFLLPGVPSQPYAQEPAPDTQRGNMEHRELQSTILNEKRSYAVYTPPGYDPKRKGAYGVLVCFDGEMYSTTLPTPTILDNLIAAKKIPPMLAVMVHSLQTRTRDLTCSTPFADFLATELLPAVRADFPGATRSARKTIAAGASLGGLCAAYCGLAHSKIFGNVLSQSGSFWLYPGWERLWNEENDNVIPGDGSIQTAVLQSRRLPVRFYLEVGTFEHFNMLRPNRHVRDLLLLKGYHVTYSEYHGGHDIACWRGSLADGLLALTRDWR